MRDVFEAVVVVSAVNRGTFCRALALVLRWAPCAVTVTLIGTWMDSEANSAQREDLVLRIVAIKKCCGVFGILSRANVFL